MSSDARNSEAGKIDIMVTGIGPFLRPFVYLDGKKVATVSFLNLWIKPVIRVNPGRHSLYVTIQSRESEIVEIDVTSGDKFILISAFGLLRALSGKRPTLTIKKQWSLLESGVKIARKVVEMGQTIKTRQEIPVQSSNTVKDGNTVLIHFNPETQKIRAAIEEVNVPNGVTITVKRSRTIEHTLNIDQSEVAGGDVNLGVKAILGLSIRGELEKRRGKGFSQSETVEYEVMLDGAKNEHYQLIWTDVWQTGIAEVRQGNETQMIPFRFRELTELNVTA